MDTKINSEESNEEIIQFISNPFLPLPTVRLPSVNTFILFYFKIIFIYFRILIIQHLLLNVKININQFNEESSIIMMIMKKINVQQLE
jgi:hypothetical protein